MWLRVQYRSTEEILAAKERDLTLLSTEYRRLLEKYRYSNSVSAIGVVVNRRIFSEYLENRHAVIHCLELPQRISREQAGTTVNHRLELP